MLPDLRFVLGALMVIAITGMIGVALFVSARLFHQAKVGPLESTRNLAFTDSAEWNQFYEPGSVRRFVDLTRQGEAREIGDLPPEHRPQMPAPAILTVDLAPVEVEQDDDVETAPLSVRPAEVADPPPIAVAAPQRTSSVATPSMPNQAGEAPVAERNRHLNTDTVRDVRPGEAEAVIASAPLPGDGKPLVEAVTGNIETEPAAASETALPLLQQRPSSTAPHPPDPHGETAAPVPTPRPAVSMATPDDDPNERPGAAITVRPPAQTSRPQNARPSRATQGNAKQRVAPRRPLQGQPVFGPNFPYATPNSRQPVFGPHFPYATPQARRRAAGARQYRTYSQPQGWR